MSDETEERRTTESFEGEEELLGGQPLASDPYTPEPGPGPGEARAFNVMRLAWIAIAVVVIAIVLYAIFG
jgi:hypothetical protein